MRTTLRRLSLFIVLLLALAPCANAEFAAKVKSGPLPVYADEGLSSRIGTLGKGTIVVVDSYANGAARITYKGRSGYAPVSGMKSLGCETRAVTLNARTKIYQKASTRAKYTKLAKGTKLTLLATSGSWALVAKNGYTGYVQKKYLTAAAEVSAAPAPIQEEAPKVEAPKAEVPSVVYGTFAAVVTAGSLPVYASASTSAKKIGTLKSGTDVTVVAYNDTWACLKKGDIYGFASRAGLGKAEAPKVESPAPEAPAEPAKPAEPESGSSGGAETGSFEQAAASGKYSNEQLIFIFLTRHMGFNAAAACGVLSNVYSESGFRPTAYNSGGGSYGICQWTGSRYTRLKNYCSEHGYDYTTLTGQLYYLEYELKNSYPKVLSYMRGVENTASGAYDAGHYWCYNFEVPANRSSRSATRGSTAKSTYWPKYS